MRHIASKRGSLASVLCLHDTCAPNQYTILLPIVSGCDQPPSKRWRELYFGSTLAVDEPKLAGNGDVERKERSVYKGRCASPATCLSPSTWRGMRPGAQSLVASFSADDLDNLQLETPHSSGDAAAQVTPTALLSPQAA